MSKKVKWNKKKLVVYPFHAIGRLNGVVSLVPVFEELFLTSRVLFGPVPKWIRKSTSFTNRTSKAADFVISFLSSDAHGATPFYRTSKWFPSIYCMDFSTCFSNVLWLFYGLGRELCTLLVCCIIRCYIDLSVLFLTKYSLLGYSLLGNLMHNKKRCVIYELTPRQILKRFTKKRFFF